jgi:2'-5' RNA ligase
MSVYRCSLAIEVPMPLQDAVEEALIDVRDRIRSDLVRWIPGRNIHLTLKFLGDTTTSNLEMVRASMEVVAAQFRPLEVAIGGFGAFPNRRNPRVLWVGLAVPDELSTLHRELDLATGRLGYTSEEREFSPHLTVGRVRQNIAATDVKGIRDELERTTLGEIGVWRADAIHLFRSELMPSGSRYSRLFSTALAAD